MDGAIFDLFPQAALLQDLGIIPGAIPANIHPEEVAVGIYKGLQNYRVKALVVEIYT